MSDLAILKDVLRTIRNRVEAGKAPPGGICSSCEDIFELELHYCGDMAMLSLDALMKIWPMHSGRDRFPVPPAKGSLNNAAGEFYNHQKFGTIWVGEYGESRKALLSFLIAQVEARIGMNA